jgi:hypothetical protein
MLNFFLKNKEISFDSTRCWNLNSPSLYIVQFFIFMGGHEEISNNRIIRKVFILSWGLLSPPMNQWYPQSKEILLNLSMKCWNSKFNAQGSRVIILVVQVEEVKIYVTSVRDQNRGWCGWSCSYLVGCCWSRTSLLITRYIYMKAYRSQGSVSTLTKSNKIFFQKWNSFLNFEIIYISIIYYNILIWVVKLFRMWRMRILMIFNISTSYFSQNFISLFRGLFNDKIDLRVRYGLVIAYSY